MSASPPPSIMSRVVISSSTYAHKAERSVSCPSTHKLQPTSCVRSADATLALRLRTSVSSLKTHSSSKDAVSCLPVSSQKNCEAAPSSMSLCSSVKGQKRPRTTSTFFLYSVSWGICITPAPPGASLSASNTGILSSVTRPHPYVAPFKRLETFPQLAVSITRVTREGSTETCQYADNEVTIT